MALSNIKLAISVDGVSAATDAFTDVNKSLDGLGRNTQTVASVMEASWAKMTAAFAAGNIITKVLDSLIDKFSQIKEAVMFAANVEQADRALSVIANTMGMTSEKALKYRDDLRDINITTNSATNATAQFIKAGFPLESLNKLGTAAQGAAISYQMMTGETISSSQALDKMIRSLVTGNVTELHTLGINVMMRDTLRQNTQATGEAAMQVDAHQRKLLMLNDVLKNTEPLMLLYSKSTDLAAKQISSSKRPIEELKLALGNLFLPELTVMATAFYRTVSEGMKWVKQHNEELTAAKLVIKDFAEGLVYATALFAAYSASMIIATAATGGFAAGAGIFSGVLSTMMMDLSLTGAAATVTATKIGLMGESIVASTTVAKMGVLSLKTAFGVLGAFMMGWEIGKVLGDKFEVVRKAGVYMVHGLMTGWDLASEAYERFTATVNPFGDEEKQQAALQAITAKYASIKKTRDEALAGSLVDAGNTSAPAAKPYVNDQNAIASGIQREKERLAEEARIKAEIAAEAARKAAAAQKIIDDKYAADVEKARETYRHYTKAFDDRTLADFKNAADLQRAELDGRHAQGLIAEQAFLDAKYALDKAAIDKHETLQLGEALTAQRAADDAEAAMLKTRVGKTDTFDAASIIRRNNALKEAEAAWKAVAASESQANIAGVKYFNDLAVSVEKYRLELQAMQADNAGLAASQVGVTNGEITDPYAHEMAMMEARYAREFELITEKQNRLTDLWNSAAAGSKEEDALSGQLAENEKKRLLTVSAQTSAQQEIAHDSYKSQLSAASQYTGMAGQMFTALASTQDQASRSGFESAKAFNIAAAIMNTASAIMSAMTAPWPMSIAAAALAAATGAIQIATIAATTFGGGASAPAAPSGSFAAGGAAGGSAVAVGASVNTPITSIQDQQTMHTLQVIADKIGNAALAMGKSADSLYIIADSFKSGSGSNVVAGAPNKFTSISDATNPVKYASNMFAGQSGLAAALVAPFTMATGLLVSLGQSMFGHGAWTQTGAGIQMQMAGGKLAAQQYIDSESKGGWFTSDRHSTSVSAADDLFVKNINAELGKMQESIKVSAVAMGINGTVMDTAINTAALDLGRIATAGRTNEQIATDIGAAFNRMSNQIITQAIPNIADYAINSAETATDAYNRLSASLMDVTAQFTLVGKAVTMTGINGANAAYQLQQLFGGADKMATAMDNYFTAMYTDTEQSALKASYASTQVTAAFMKMGLEVPKTNAEFNALRNSVTDPALFAALTALGPTFAEITKQATDASATVNAFNSDLISRGLKTNGQTSLADLYDLKVKQENEMIDATKNGMDTQWLAIVQQGEYAAAIKKASETVDAAIQKIIDSSKKALTDAISTAQGLLNTLHSIMTGSTAMLSPQAAYNQAKASFLGADSSTASAAATAFLDASKNYSSSNAAYQSDYQTVIAKLGALAETAPTLSYVDQQLALLGQIKTSIDNGDMAMAAALQITYNAAQIDMGTAKNSLTIALEGIQAALNTTITAGTSKSDIQAEISALQLKLNLGVTGTAKDAISNSIALLQLAMNGTITADTAQSAIDTAYTTIQGALNGTINGTVSATLIAAQSAIIQNTLDGTISGSDARTKLQAEQKIIQDVLNGSIDGNTAATSLSSQFTTVTQSLTTGLDSFVTKLGLYVKAMNDATTQAGVNQTLLGNQNAAIDTFSRASTAYQSTVTGLVSQYTAGTLSPTDYATQNNAAYAPLNAAYTTATGLGITTLPAPVERAIADAEIDARMKLKAATIATTVMTASMAGGQPYNAQYDIAPLVNGKSQPDGTLNLGDVIVWQRIAQGLNNWSSIGLPAFAKGGVTNQPSIFGEAGWEAAVPLPDGRSIPVKFSDNYRLDVSELVSELKALREEVKELRNEQRAGQVAIADNTGKTARQLSRWDGDGMPAVRDAV